MLISQQFYWLKTFASIYENPTFYSEKFRYFGEVRNCDGLTVIINEVLVILSNNFLSCETKKLKFLIVFFLKFSIALTEIQNVARTSKSVQPTEAV